MKNHTVYLGVDPASGQRVFGLMLPRRRGPTCWVLVDGADLAKIRHVRWTARVDGNRTYAQGKVEGRTTQMHRLLTDAPKGMDVDHRNGNGLDNRGQNLRVVSHATNMLNVRSHRGSTSQYRGVSWNRVSKRWVAQISRNNRTRSLGTFRDEHAAARAYDSAARALHGEHARLNFPDEDDGW